MSPRLFWASRLQPAAINSLLILCRPCTKMYMHVPHQEIPQRHTHARIHTHTQSCVWPCWNIGRCHEIHHTVVLLTHTGRRNEHDGQKRDGNRGTREVRESENDREILNEKERERERERNRGGMREVENERRRRRVRVRQTEVLSESKAEAHARPHAIGIQKPAGRQQ